MSLLSKIYRKIRFIFIGDIDRFSLEHRVFNLLSFFTCIGAFVSLFLNLGLGLYESSVVSMAICLVQAIILYISRVEKKFNLAVTLTGFEMHILLGINYFINGGIIGPTPILFLATIYIIATVASQKATWFWLVLNLCLLAVLISVEYFYPQAILVGYSNKLLLVNDVYITYLFVVFLMTAGIFYTRRAYEKQKRTLQAKAIALEQLNSEKNKLFSIISHDLKAPIGTVKQYLDFLKENDLNEEEKDIIENGLMKSINEAYDLLDNLLIWAKSQMGGAKPFEKQLDVKQTLYHELNQAKNYAEHKGVLIIEDIEKDIVVKADENMLKLVIRNLLFNAVKFSDTNEKVIFSVFKEQDQVIFKVEDNGVGISEENQKNIFSLNVQTTIGTKKEKGTGLGLVLCKEYTHLQNGEIWFETEVGHGSTFYVSLPFISKKTI
ncbi:sensor histidine kinase [Pedobacter arcticus]|uniref:sensor histidine kinase n=1 Tax=Pedobacter arcticus TaxID=752140 RepID=UPI0003754E5D|nr:HAMP domain-containing sensor histidine kinase [Pedobacter arcticus]